MDNPEPQNEGAWDEDDSATFRAVGAVAVPDREEQLATLLCLLPFRTDEEFTAVDLGSGEGALSAALLRCFPSASVVALDGSASMRSATQAALAPFGTRATVAPFDLFSTDPPPALDEADCVLSSLVLHHLDGAAKRRFFGDAAARISGRGALLIADLVAPRRPEARSLFAETWDGAVRIRSRALFGNEDAYDRFVATRWNWYRWPDPGDLPSPLSDQLRWLTESGFHSVDCFWMRAGHAVFGGYGAQAAPPPTPLSFDRAHAAIQRSLGHRA
jgi:tRNA (cmo5U34)-methyltransferase